MISGNLAKKLLPEKRRSSLSFEAGANDGLAFPMVMFPFLFIQHSTGEAIKEFFLQILLWENITAIVLAAFAGYLFGRANKMANKRKLMDNQAIIGYSIALTFCIYGLFEVIKTNSIVSVFAAGVLFNAEVSKKESVKEESVQEVLERLLIIPIFFLFGLIKTFAKTNNLLEYILSDRSFLQLCR